MPLLLQLFCTFAKIGAFTFGGGYAMLSVIDHECVKKRGWLTADELVEMTVIAESTPGPIAINCDTFTGYRQAGLVGAAVATLGMALPSFVILFLLSGWVEQLLQYPLAAAAFRGIRLAVALLVLHAALRMLHRPKGENARQHRLGLAIAAAAFGSFLVLTLLGCRVSAVVYILLSGLLGWLLFACPSAARPDTGGPVPPQGESPSLPVKKGSPAAEKQPAAVKKVSSASKEKEISAKEKSAAAGYPAAGEEVHFAADGENPPAAEKSPAAQKEACRP